MLTLERLINDLKDIDWETRYDAIKGLRRLKDPRAIEALTLAMSDNDEDIRKEAAAALTEITGQPHTAELVYHAISDTRVDQGGSEPVDEQPNDNTTAEWKAVVMKEGFSRIQAVARDGVNDGAVASLALWGAINIAAWFFLGTKDREFLNRLDSELTGGIYLLHYGGLILGGVMLALSALAITSRFRSSAIYFDGVALLLLGIWNFSYDFIAAAALRPYGYALAKTDAFIKLFGIFQVLWGRRRFSLSKRIRNWSPAHLTTHELKELKEILRHFIATPVQAEGEIVKATITNKGPLGWDVLSSTTHYTGRLLDDCALMVSADLVDCFIIDRKSVTHRSLSDTGKLSVYVEGMGKDIDFNGLSAVILRRWAGISKDAVESFDEGKYCSSCQNSNAYFDANGDLFCPRCKKVIG